MQLPSDEYEGEIGFSLDMDTFNIFPCYFLLSVIQTDFLLGIKNSERK